MHSGALFGPLAAKGCAAVVLVGSRVALLDALISRVSLSAAIV
jgi:hypothetical protein